LGGKLPTAEIIIIGTELLLGEIQDTNTRTIAQFFRNEGIDFYRSTIIGDNENRITTMVQEAIQRSNIVITSGGLGPTVDDPTRSAIANALGVDLVFLPELWEQINQRFQRYGRIPTENNRKQAFIPDGAIAIENKVGTAPAFYFKTGNGLLVSLPGVPGELEFLLENKIKYILENFFTEKNVIDTLTIHTSGLGESVIDEKIAEFETLSNPTVGIAAYPGQIDIRITAKASNKIHAQEMINDVLYQLQPHLGDSIFGFNEQKLDQLILDLLTQMKTKIFVIENGFDQPFRDTFPANLLVLNKNLNFEENLGDTLEINIENLYKHINPNILLILNLNVKEFENSILSLQYKFCDQEISTSFTFGGHHKFAYTWAKNTVLNFLRLHLSK
jgi:competence/damage-inducible protein CinA-like protein